jgi:hypothetical protein
MNIFLSESLPLNISDNMLDPYIALEFKTKFQSNCMHVNMIQSDPFHFYKVTLC